MDHLLNRDGIVLASMAECGQVVYGFHRCSVRFSEHLLQLEYSLVVRGHAIVLVGSAAVLIVPQFRVFPGLQPFLCLGGWAKLRSDELGEKYSQN